MPSAYLLQKAAIAPTPTGGEKIKRKNGKDKKEKHGSSARQHLFSEAFFACLLMIDG